jgi:hypothetical protein
VDDQIVGRLEERGGMNLAPLSTGADHCDREYTTGHRSLVPSVAEG